MQENDTGRNVEILFFLSCINAKRQVERTESNQADTVGHRYPSVPAGRDIQKKHAVPANGGIIDLH